jgi:hypothetical protein
MGGGAGGSYWDICWLFYVPYKYVGAPALVYTRQTNPLASKLRLCLVHPHMMPTKTSAGPNEVFRLGAMRLPMRTGNPNEANAVCLCLRRCGHCDSIKEYWIKRREHRSPRQRIGPGVLVRCVRSGKMIYGRVIKNNTHTHIYIYSACVYI